MSRIAITRALLAALSLCFIASATIGHAQSVEELKKGVVKITAQADGKTKVGTGFIERLEKDAAYIVTASHAIEGDPQPKVVFRGKESKSFSAQVKGKKGGDPRGLAVLVVSGDVPQGVEALPASSDFEINGGEEVTVIGFPRTPAVPWAVTPGVVTGQEGEYLVFSGAAAEGNSGGPVLQNGQVVGVVTEVLSSYGYAVPIPILRLALRGWGVSLETTSKVARRLPEEKGEKEQLPREITGKDGAPMVRVPVGEFWMGSFDGNKYEDEHPRHKVTLDAFYMDKYEVTNRLFQQFVQQTSYHTTAEQEGTSFTSISSSKWWSPLSRDEYGPVSGAQWRKPEAGETVFASGRVEHPVVSVLWVDAQAYCRWAGKRLPTEAEFEYAMRAGTTTEFWWGDTYAVKRRVENMGNRSENQAGYDEGDGRTTPVGSYEINPWGLHDMNGNVSELVADWYDSTYYSRSPEHNPKGPSQMPQGIESIVRRGGTFHVGLRSANRTPTDPRHRSDFIGFRCAQDVK